MVEEMVRRIGGMPQMPEEGLTQKERDFLCKAYEQAKDHPQRQVIDDPLQSMFGTEELLRLRGLLEGRGYLDRGGVHAAGTSLGGFWLTRAGMNEAERLCREAAE
jgi:hypothetical protein